MLKPMGVRILAVVGLWAGPVLASSAATVQINWGSLAFSTLKDSEGNVLTEADFTFALGTFDAAFVPTFDNREDWHTQWQQFDVAAHNQDDGYFTGIGYLGDGGKSYEDSSGSISNPGSADYDFSGNAAYLWVYNQTLFDEPTVEWFLARANDWVFPEAPEGCCPNSLPLEWSMSDLDNEAITPVWGAQSETDNKVGAGFASNPGSHSLQTYSAIPEISALPAMLAVVLAVGLYRERRHRPVVESA